MCLQTGLDLEQLQAASEARKKRTEKANGDGGQKAPHMMCVKVSLMSPPPLSLLCTRSALFTGQTRRVSLDLIYTVVFLRELFKLPQLWFYT